MINIDGFDVDVTEEELTSLLERHETGVKVQDILPFAPSLVREYFISSTPFDEQFELFRPPTGEGEYRLLTSRPGEGVRLFWDMRRVFHPEEDITAVSDRPGYEGVDLPAVIPRTQSELEACGMVSDLLAVQQVDGNLRVVLTNFMDWLVSVNQRLLLEVSYNNRRYLRENIDIWIARAVTPPPDVQVHPYVRSQVEAGLRI